MKNFTLSILLLAISFTTFAQAPSCPSYFRRNNGNGACAQGQLKLYFTNCPVIAPIIDSVYNNGIKLNIVLALPDVSKCLSQNYIGYCILNSNVVPTSSNWQIFFRNPNSGPFSCNVPEGGPLPVQYLSFDALVANNNVTLKWITTQETNNDRFEIERSFDNSNFAQLGTVRSGTTLNNTNKSYQYTDNATDLQNRTIVYYRLKQFDIDGQFTYSKIIAVKLKSKNGAELEVSPNPFVETVNMRFSALENGTAQIRILNNVGQTMLSKQSTISKGFNNMQVDGLGKLASGMYMAQLVVNGIVVDNQRVIKSNL